MIPVIELSKLKSAPEMQKILYREPASDPHIESTVAGIISDVRKRGDNALKEYTARFDNYKLTSIEPVEKDILLELHSKVDDSFITVLREAIENVREFHSLQLRPDIELNKPGGARLSLRFIPLDSVGLYVPGGEGAYPSTIVMNAVPAQVAGVKRMIVTTPPARFRDNPHVAAALVELGIEEVYTVGGAQAIAALAYGTESIPRVDKIVGPGNIYVAIAKKLVYGSVDIDMIAGPSEIVIIADDTADPSYVAADLLSQAEHGSGMETALLLTTSLSLAEMVRDELYSQLESLPFRERTAKVLDSNAIIIVNSIEEAAETSNLISPEHLELMVENPRELLKNIRHAGAVFIGPYSPEPISDYYGGTNHVLPTSGTARFASPLGVYDFLKCQSVAEYTEKAVRDCAEKVAILARAEGFEAHARAVLKRLDNNGNIK